jgi:trk system potassium uptake protein TrkA
MNLIVIGCGRVGSELAYHLFKQGHQVCIVDQNEKAFLGLPIDFHGRTLGGDALNQIILRRAGMETADGVVVVTNSDMTNAVVGHVAQTVYKVPSVVVGNFEPHYRYIYDAFNLQVVSPSHWGAQRIEEMLYGQEARMVFSAGNGEVELYELLVPPVWDGHFLRELIPDQDCTPAALTRAGRAALPQLDMLLHQGDLLLVSATLEGIRDIRRRLESLQEV